MTAGDAVADDIEQIQRGMNNSSEDLSSFFDAIRRWLDAFRSLLASELSPEADPAPELGPEIPTSISTATPSITYQGPVPVLTVAPDTTAKPTSSLCRPAAGAGPLVPCPESSTTSFLTVISTSTRSNTITTYQTISYLNASGPFANGTAPVILPTAAPYPAINTSSTSTSYTVEIITATAPAFDPSASTSTTAILLSYALSPTPSPYVFNASSIDNVAVYYGTSPNTRVGGLLDLCVSSNTDIVILSFVYDFFSAGGWPSIAFGPGCVGPNAVQQEAGATGLQDCEALAPQIARCQQLGKKVFVSLGGWDANSSFESPEQAQGFATTLWDLFGAGTGLDPELRPFGPSQAITVDGFDLDNEDHDGEHWDLFATALRSRFADDLGKTYYLSAAPQCTRPDHSISLDVMRQVDFVWVQFYNNPSCNLDVEAFQASFKAWSEDLAALQPETPDIPRLFVGVPSFPGAGSGYVNGNALYSRITQARELDVVNLGGIMMWEGTEANVDRYGVDFLSYAKNALHL